MAAIYLTACVWALWSRIGAVLLLALASPVAARFMFPKDAANKSTRLLLGVAIDGSLAALAFLPVVGDVVDLGAAAVGLVLLVLRFKQLASSLPAGLACLALYVFVWFEASLLPHRLSAANIHHPFWSYPVTVIGAILAGGVILAALAMLLSLMYDGDRAKAVLSTIGFPWFLLAFFLTIFLPGRHARDAHEAAAIVRRPRNGTG
jgi:hypothetical protein